MLLGVLVDVDMPRSRYLAILLIPLVGRVLLDVDLLSLFGSGLLWWSSLPILLIHQIGLRITGSLGTLILRRHRRRLDHGMLFQLSGTQRVRSARSSGRSRVPGGWN